MFKSNGNKFSFEKHKRYKIHKLNSFVNNSMWKPEKHFFKNAEDYDNICLYWNFLCIFSTVLFYQTYYNFLFCYWVKSTTIPFTEASDSLLVANGDLKRKLEYVVSEIILVTEFLLFVLQLYVVVFMLQCLFISSNWKSGKLLLR